MHCRLSPLQFPEQFISLRAGLQFVRLLTDTHGPFNDAVLKSGLLLEMPPRFDHSALLDAIIDERTNVPETERFLRSADFGHDKMHSSRLAGTIGAVLINAEFFERWSATRHGTGTVQGFLAVVAASATALLFGGLQSRRDPANPTAAATGEYVHHHLVRSN
jgi:hypothetical protein